MKTVAVVGLGEMGLPMARNLAARGFEVRGYDIRPAAVAALVDSGGRAAASAGDAAAGADAVVIMVRTPVQADEVVLQEGGVLARMRPDAVLIVMSTVGLSCMRRLGEAARARGVAFLDAPVSGGRAGAEDGTLTIIVGGEAAALSRARPVMEAVGSRIVHVGGLGAGTVVKMANQVLLTTSLLAAREVAELALSAGVPVERAWDVIRTCTGTSWVVEHWPVASAWIRHYVPGSSLDILVKDTGLALDLARAEGVPAPLLGLVSQMIAALAHGARTPV